ncbi:MAG: hypothetical protein ACON47_03140 [Flavobacteriaceae bacterium]
MKKIALLFFIMTYSLQGQEAEDLFAEMESLETIEQRLLPDRMLFTQRLLWGEKGLMRSFNRFELTVEKRERELKLRRKVLVAHQLLGYVTLAGMVAQGVLGTQLYNRKYNLYETHKILGNLTSATYFTTAALSLFAPPPLIAEKKGLSSTRAHKWLATIHFSAMVATNVLADERKKWHRAAAYTAFGSYATAMIVLTF